MTVFWGVEDTSVIQPRFVRVLYRLSRKNAVRVSGEISSVEVHFISVVWVVVFKSFLWIRNIIREIESWGIGVTLVVDLIVPILGIVNYNRGDQIREDVHLINSEVTGDLDLNRVNKVMVFVDCRVSNYVDYSWKSKKGGNNKLEWQYNVTN